MQFVAARSLLRPRAHTIACVRPLVSVARRALRLRQCQVLAWADQDKRQASSSASIGSPDTTAVLRNLHNGAEIYLVGTAHVSKRSAEEVREVISLVQPDAVMLELCPARARRLMTGQGNTSDVDFLREALGSLFAPGSNPGGQLFKFSLQAMYRIMRALGLNPGGEFKAAMEAAAAHNAKIVCGDQDMQLTLQRLAASVNMQDLLSMLASGGPSPPQEMVDFFERGSGTTGGATASFEAKVEAMKTRSMAREMSNYLRSLNPALAAALIDERDAHMVRQLQRLRGRVVGVVGLAHLDGIERLWSEAQASSRPAGLTLR